MRSFQHLSKAWKDSSLVGISDGHSAYARRQAIIYRQLYHQTKKDYEGVAVPALLEMVSIQALSVKIKKLRSYLFKWAGELVLPYSILLQTCTNSCSRKCMILSVIISIVVAVWMRISTLMGVAECRTWFLMDD
jgi:hypothetical protein